MSEYDPIGLAPEGEDEVDLDAVRDRFGRAARPFVASPWSWLAWGLILPAAALGTRRVLAAGGPRGLLVLWSLAVLLGGAIEVGQILRRRRAAPGSPLAGWVLRRQGNLSMVALALSVVLIWQEAAWLLPGLWLLLLGHNLYTLGGLAFRPLAACGLIYQAGGLAALWPHGRGLEVFAAATFIGGLWAAWSIARASRASRPA